ncbi:hypothetical protein NRI82_004155 [Vibrio vulnificus]|nr:hypothetical protein [Vibrio vulnificus]ELI0612289.1 hypothetical protein [Vibrio vulnificus]
MNDKKFLDSLLENALDFKDIQEEDMSILDAMFDNPEKLAQVLKDNELLDNLLVEYDYKEVSPQGIVLAFFNVVSSWFSEKEIDFQQPYITPLFDFLLVRRQLLEVIQQFKI